MAKRADLSGQKFGRLTVISFSHTDPKSGAVWLCKCDCGNDYLALAKTLKASRVISCGCARLERAARLKAEKAARLEEERAAKQRKREMRDDLTGEVFGELTVLELYSKGKQKRADRWLCQCSCGNTCTASRESLVYNGRISCGCMTGKNSRGTIYGKHFATRAARDKKRARQANQQSIAEIAKAASAAGMTYGEYVASLK